MDFISDFIAFAAKVGCSPAQGERVRADDKLHYFTIEGHKPNSKKGAYQLKISGDFAVGWVRNFRDGDTHSFTSKTDKKFTADERAAWKAKVDAERKIKDTELKQQREDASSKARKIWGTAEKEGYSSYLNRKKCALNGARFDNDIIVIPVYRDGKISTLQFIDQDGDKRFLYGGEMAGGYYPLATKSEDKSIIVICEGFATGSSIRQATDFPVIVAFNAGNLLAVAKDIKNRYPDTKIIMAADNDAFTEIKGKPFNVGVVKAQEASVSIGGALVIIPPIVNNKATDFNDVFCSQGAEAVKSIFDSVLNKQPEPIAPIETKDEVPSYLDEVTPLEAYNEEARETVALYAAKDKVIRANWREELNYDKNGKLFPKSLNNALLIIENDKVLGHLFCYDEFSNEKRVYRCPPWEEVEHFKVRAVNDDDITMLTATLEKRGIMQPFGVIGKLLSTIIKKNSRNPAIEYFEGLKWDGIRRLDTWLRDYCGAAHDDVEYVSAVGRKWLVASVTRVFRPGTKFDHMLILESRQGAGKSLMLQELATIGGNAYFDDTIKVSDLGLDRTVPKLQGCLIIELAEMTGLDRKDISELKQNITQTHDRVVLKYQNEPSLYPRQFVYAGTINPTDSGYLTDDTGNRRFWCVKIGDSVDMEAFKRDKEQLWAEAVQAFRSGEKLYLEGELEEKAKEAQRHRLYDHPWTPDIEEIAYGRDCIYTEDIWKKLGIEDRTRRTRLASNDIAKIMRKLGFELKTKRFGGNPTRAWTRKENDMEIELD